jgi:hypothetical protein
MTNEQYLIVSYFLVAVVLIGMGFFTYLLLRKSFASVTEETRSRNFARVLRRLFPASIILPALVGFLSVTYYGCGKDSYASIIASRSFLMEVNQRQISTGLTWIVLSVVVWGIVVALVLATRRPTAVENDRPPEDKDRLTTGSSK